jgi:hypothetical protein
VSASWWYTCSGESILSVNDAPVRPVALQPAFEGLALLFALAQQLVGRYLGTHRSGSQQRSGKQGQAERRGHRDPRA